MHLVVAERGSIHDGNEAVDLGQTPGDILFLSAADSELAALSRILGSRNGGPSWRLTPLKSLNHPMSVDLWIERTTPGTRLVVLRALGGVSYFSYLIEALSAAARRQGFALAVLPGDDRPDPELDRPSTLGGAERAAMLSYFSEGGPTNLGRFADMAEAIVTGADMPEGPEPLLKAGLFLPGGRTIDPGQWRQAHRDPARPLAALVVYRSLVQAGQTAPVDALSAALSERGLDVMALYVTSLKDAVAVDTLHTLFAADPPAVILNATAFAVSSPATEGPRSVLDETGAVVLQIVLSGSPRAAWLASKQGMNGRDLAMHVALPELDGRVLSRAIAFKAAARHDASVQADIIEPEAEPSRIAFVADLAAGWAQLNALPASNRRVAIVLANYPNRDGRLGNGVGLDTPAGTVEVLKAMAGAGYGVQDCPADGNDLMDRLMAGPTNAAIDARIIRETLSLKDYKHFFGTLPVQIQDEVTARWGAPDSDPFVSGEVFALPLMRLGSVVVGIQPARGYNIDPKETYHSPDLVPPHGYLAFYAWLRTVFSAHAVIHMGKHGNLEWLPGKALALSEACYPEACLGPLPHLYPFIVNDPGEGTQAKRRAAAVIIDHLTPPLTRAESYGPLKALEGLVDEYYDAQSTDPRREVLLRKQILELARDTGITEDAGLAGASDDDALVRLDAWLCDLKELQIRDGLHVFGVSPEGRLLNDLATALARIPRGSGEGREASLIRALSTDLLNVDRAIFDPLDCDFAALWTGPRPDCLSNLLHDPWRSTGDTVERLELFAAGLVSDAISLPDGCPASAAVMADLHERILPRLEACGKAEIAALLTGLNGRFVQPGPSGAPTRGRPDVLPTGKNFFSVDSRAIPTPAAWELGRKSAELLVTRYVQDHGEWPKAFALTAWGTSNMRTGGDDIAQALALIGARPVWDLASNRLTGYEIITPALLGRPRVDVTLRISGFFRDAFPDQIALFDRAARAIARLDEDDDDNPLAARHRRETAELVAQGVEPGEADKRAGFRVFGSKPGAYGAGLQALIDEKGWDRRGDLAEAYLVWGGYAYGAEAEGKAERGLFETRLRQVQAVVQNQDNREHDLLDSDDYYQFEGGMSAAVEALSGARPSIYHNDHSRPERPVIRSLEEEVSRVVRGRVVNPKWIAGVMRHGYKGAFEITATVDYMFAFAATTGAVRDHHFEAAYQAFIADDAVRAFMEDNNHPALRELAARFLEAIDRGLWVPRSNSARFDLEEIR